MANDETLEKGAPADETGLGLDEDQDVLFQAQMAVGNFVLGFWKQIVGIIFLILAVVFVKGQLDTMEQDAQREIQEGVSEVTRRLPQNPLGLTDAEKGVVAEGAKRLEKLGLESKGTGAVVALVKAGESFLRAGLVDDAERAFQAAVDRKAGDVLGWTAANGLAHVKVAKGDVAGAEALYKGLWAQDTSVLGQYAKLELARLLEAQGRASEARTLLAAFATEHADSPLANEVGALLQRLGDAQ